MHDVELKHLLNSIVTICDQACKSQPCEHKKLPTFRLFSYITYELLILMYNIKSLSLLQNLMGFLLKFTEIEYHINFKAEDISKCTT